MGNHHSSKRRNGGGDNEVQKSVTFAEESSSSVPPPDDTEAARRQQQEEIEHRVSVVGRCSAIALEDVYTVNAKIIGRGHYGVVRRCTHKVTKEVCAVKAVAKKRVTNHKSLTHEINILKNVEHENIISIRGVFEDGTHIYIVTELCTGGELFDRIIEKTHSSEGHYSEHDAALIVKQILEGINYCHKHDVCHRDLKPENFLFSTEAADAKIKIIDFGLSREEVKHDASIMLHTRVGTPYYIAPEVLKRSYSFPCDIWSIGIVTYILLCGYPPFSGENDAEIFGSIRRGLTKESFPRDDWGSISGYALSFIKNLLSLDPSDRYTAEEALADPWLVETLHPDISRRPAVPRLSGDQLASRLKQFVNLTQLKKAALNILAHHLTEREIAELSKIWKEMDKDNNKRITFGQLQHTLHQNGHHTTKVEMNAFMAGLDVNEDHVIDYYEFAAAMLCRNKTIRDDRLRDVFNAMDVSQTGAITLDDLTHIMGSRKNAEEVLDDINPPDGNITFDMLKDQLERV